MRLPTSMLALIAGLTCLAGPVAAAEKVPGETIRSIRVKWVEPDADTTDANKIRRYQSMIRTGRQVIREYPDAQNLYMVRGLMLQATRGLLILNVGDVDREAIIELAQAIVDSQAPPGWRFEADLLLTQVHVAQLAAAGEEKAEQIRPAIEEFVARYEDTKVYAQAVMRAADMANTYQQSRLYRDYLNHLQRDLIFQPGVGSFLVRNGRRVSPRGRSFRYTLQGVDGKDVQLPLRLMGKTSLVIFWDPRSERSRNMLGDLGSYIRFNRDRGAHALGIALGDDLPLIRKAVGEARADFPQVVLPAGSDSLLMEAFGISEVPMFLLIGADGKVHSVPRHHSGIRWSDAREEVEERLQVNWRKRDYMQGARSGMVLVDVLTTGGGKEVRRLGKQVLHARMLGNPHRRQRLKKHLAGIRQEADSASPADKARLELLAIVVDRWLYLGRDQQRTRPEWTSKAEAILADPPDRAAAILADYFVTLQDAQDMKDPSAKILAYAGRYADGDLVWACELLTTVLGYEAGRDDIHQQYRRELQAERYDVSAVRAFLRGVNDVRPVAWYAPRTVTLEKVQGGQVTIPNDLDSAEAIVLHFWTDDAPIGSAGRFMLRYETESLHVLTSSPGEKVKIVSVYVGDGDLAAAKELSREHPDWVHTYAPGGWDNELLRQLDVRRLPSSWMLGRLGSVLVSDCAVHMPRALEETIEHGGRFWYRDPRTFDDWYRYIWRLFTHLQGLKAADAILHPGTAEEVKRVRQDHVDRTVRWVEVEGRDTIDRERRRFEEILEPMIDARKEEDTPLTDEQREQLAGIMDKCESIIRRLERINELVRGDLWDPVRHFRENPIPKHMERILWFRHREDRLSDPQKAFLDRIFKRLEAPDGRYWRWRMQRPPE